MADDIETVNVEAPASKPARASYQGLSPLQAGLLYGGAASAVAGPIGPLVGLLYGIAAKRQKDSFLDSQARYAQVLEGRRQALSDQIASEYEQADPDEKRLLDHARRLQADGFQMLMSGDPNGEKQLQDASDVVKGIIGADSGARKADEAAAMAAQRQLIAQSATGYRNEYQQTLNDHDTIQSRTGRVFDLLSKPDFDTNKPFFKAIIGDLITEGMGMYRDTPDAWDAISNKVGGFSGIALDAVAGLMKSEDFKLSREDAYRIALNMRQFSDQQAQGKLTQLGSQTQQLEQLARHTRAIGDDFSLGDYVSGGVKELKLLPVPPVAPTPANAAERAVSSITGRPSSQPAGTQFRLSRPRRGARPVN